MGFNTDNLAADFAMIISCLQAVLPYGTVAFLNNASVDFVQKELDIGHIVVDHLNFKVFGIELGEDPLHIYMRLLEAVNLVSREGAWAIRCLRKALGSWNPLTRIGHESAEHEDAQDEELYAGDDAADTRGPLCAVLTIHDILSAYFSAKRLPSVALGIVCANAMQNWNHPVHGTTLPPCAKAVIIDDIAR